MGSAIQTKLLGALLVVGLATVLPRHTAWGQTVTGSVTGEVSDQTGALVAHAQVTAENVSTGVKTQGDTNDAGVYSLRFLPIGQYRLMVDASGFGTLSTPVFTLEINQTVKLNERLSVGAASTVDVTTAASILNTNDASLGITLSTNEIANIPLNGRNFSSATLFQPGAVTTDPTGFTGSNAIERIPSTMASRRSTATAIRRTTTRSTERTRTNRKII